MSDCDSLIKDACNFRLSEDDSAAMEKCNKVMGDFRKGADICKKSPTNCTCWNQLEKDIVLVKPCKDIGETLYFNQMFCLNLTYFSKIK